MNTTRFISRLLPVAALLPLSVIAHPGHDLSDASVSHIVTSPYHVLVIGVCGAAMIWAGTRVQRQVPARVLSATGAFMMVGAVVLWGLGL